MRYIILHGHIFKNAGSTFDWSLQKNFGEGFLDHRHCKLMRRNGREQLKQLVGEHHRLCALSSHHMTRDLPMIDGVDFITVNLLRHPIIRFRSVYDFERRQISDTPGARVAKEKNFRDYVAWRMQPDVGNTIRNYQTHYLAGHHGFANGTEVAMRYFPLALENVVSSTLIGIVERYDESMVVMEDELRGYFPDIDLSYVRQNASGRRIDSETEEGLVTTILDELGDLQKQVIDENSFDLALYQTGGAALQSKINRVDKFEEKLENFRRRCAQRLFHY